ncbi:DMT family transporter [Bifidobacterium sp.]|jgi:drug/metabolite transporter (DMT)-like permease|uniref:DMT family transporter n=1 Tax=Bifidobacterium sp. TaxID=41200 RepID=UPI0025C20441|nr:DMT family transporter [Bifidobacterium sp.]MCI1634922.1 DMT family transporter [Bifidobacterium sp.]
MKQRSQAFIALVAAAAFWAGNYVFGHLAVESMTPFSIVFLRWTLAVIPLAVIAQFLEHPDWRKVLSHWPFLLMQAVLGMFAYNFLLYAALHVSTAFEASLINAANPALIAIAAMVFLHERPGWRGGIGIAVALFGVLIVLTHGNFSTLFSSAFGPGALLMIGAILVWTAYSIAGRMGPQLPPVTSVCVQSVMVSVALGLAAPVVGVTLPSSGTAFASLLFIAVFPSCLSYVLWNMALTRIPSGKAGVFLNLITLFTAIWAITTGEAITASQIIGGIVVIAGVVLTAFSKQQGDLQPQTLH